MNEKEIKEQLNLILNELEEGNETGELLNDAGVAYYLLGEFEKSKQYLKKAIDINCTPAYLFNLANTYSQLNQAELAIDFYLQVLKLDPTHTGSLNNLADEYERMGDPEKAHELFHYLTHLQPDEAISHFNLGNFFLRQNQHIEAAKCYEKAIQNEPDFTNAYYNIAWILYKAKAYEQSLNYVHQGLKIDKTHSELVKLKIKLTDVM